MVTSPQQQQQEEHAQEASNTSLPRLRLSRGVRKKPAPKLNMNIPADIPQNNAMNIFSSKSLAALPPMPKQFRNSQSKEASSPVPLSLNLVDNNGGANGNSNENCVNGLPSAATTLTVTSVTTLNDESIPSDRTAGLITSFNTKFKLEENDEAAEGLSETYLSKTPTDTWASGEELMGKSIESLTEEDWKVLHQQGLIQTLEVLGEGNGGSVKECKTLTKNPAVFALKVITTDPSPEFQKQMVRELNYNRKFNSPFIVKYYGTFLDESSSSIHICMEYMGGRSLDAIYKAFKERDGRLSEKPLGKIAGSVLKGLAYLNENKVMHRDIKPQNILLDTKGNVKLCDFGVSGDVVNSLATTFTGTSFYMAPERIKNEPYTISCDVWSLGLTVLEGALGEFPFVRESSPELHISPLDLLIIILEFEPILEDEPDEGIKWSKGFKDFIKVCLTKEGRQRPSPRQMLEHPWLLKMMSKSVRMDKLVECCWG